ncbi:MAG TPA: hypothetical protein VMV05_01600 [bacterium]|nr:hypothetical protein [bacterium]
MKTPANLRPFPLRLIGILSILSFTIGFGVSFQSDSSRAQELGQLAWNHLLYAIELKDDMAMIDWAKSLEKSENCLAFRASHNSKTLAEGGNQDFINKVDLTLPFAFPNHFYAVFVSNKPSTNTVTLLLVYRANPGPVAWGVLALVISFISGAFSAWALARQPLPRGVNPDSASIGQVQISKPIPPEATYSKTVKPDQAYLFLDKQFVIRQAHPKAAEFFGKKTDDLLNGHLFDLAPDPQLMKAIEEGLEIKNLKPFHLNPNLSVTLQPDPNGTLLVLNKFD